MRFFFDCKDTKKNNNTFTLGMIFLNKRTISTALALLTLLTINSCNKFSGDVTVPAWLHLDAIDVVAQQENAPSVEPGFYSSLIDAAQIVMYFEGDTAETNLGTFQLPCTIPVLRHGTMKYLNVVPCVKQNGVASTRIEYPYLEHLRIEGLRLSPDSITHIGTLDSASGRHILHTHYHPLPRLNVLAEDYFEPTSFATHFDSTLVWVKNDPENACTGQGYGTVHVNKTDSIVRFYIPEEFSASKTKYLYLEMDYRADMLFEVYLTGFVNTSSNASTMSVMRIYGNKKWQKIYINLGKAWSQFNYNNPFSVSFAALNTEGIEGDIRIDNIKIITI